jgi:4-diphosphocytidyl-2-C-methyl-D-erythritol kinase
MTTQSTQFLAPAKLNLFLHITGRRQDGYHELQTVFQLLDFGDRMAFEVSNDGILSLHLTFSEDVKTDTPLDNNLVTSAAQLLRLEVGNPLLGASISL